jgi:hypothetical protein
LAFDAIGTIAPVCRGTLLVATESSDATTIAYYREFLALL